MTDNALKHLSVAQMQMPVVGLLDGQLCGHAGVGLCVESFRNPLVRFLWPGLLPVNGHNTVLVFFVGKLSLLTRKGKEFNEQTII